MTKGRRTEKRMPKPEDFHRMLGARDGVKPLQSFYRHWEQEYGPRVAHTWTQVAADLHQQKLINLYEDSFEKVVNAVNNAIEGKSTGNYGNWRARDLSDKGDARNR